jgi:hypothetical protein
MSLRHFILILSAVIFSCGVLHAQEENGEAVECSIRYVDLRIKSLQKYNTRIERQQKFLLKRLARKERRFANRLRKNDSTGYQTYLSDNVTYDSIGKLVANDSASRALKLRTNKTFDTLRKIGDFAHLDDIETANSSKGKIDELQQKSTNAQDVDRLIAQRTSRLKKLSNANYGFKSIDESVFYCKERMAAFKNIEEQPTIAEDKALTYLEGCEGFDKQFKSNNASDNLSGNNNLQQTLNNSLQTNKLLQSQLVNRVGPQSTVFGQQIRQQVDKFQSDLNGAQKVKDASSFKKMAFKPFKMTSMRGVPFAKRFAKQISIQYPFSQVLKGENSLSSAVSVSFKHTKELSYGLGILSTMNLGNGFDHMKFTVASAGFKFYVTNLFENNWGVYLGYEKLFRMSESTDNKSDFIPSKHNVAGWSEKALIGVVKKYRISKNYSNSVMLLYDIWWRNKGLSSPFVIQYNINK